MTTSRKRIVELVQQAVEESDKTAEDWVVRFMHLLHKEDAPLAQAVKDIATEKYHEVQVPPR